MKNTFCYVAVRTRLELVTPCVTGMYSNQTELTHHFHDCRRKITSFLGMAQIFSAFFCDFCVIF